MTLPAGAVDELGACADDLAGLIDDYIAPARTSPASRPSSAPVIRLFTPPPGDRPGPVRRRDHPDDRRPRRTGRRLRVGDRARDVCGTCRCCSSCPSSRAPASVAPCWTGSLPIGDGHVRARRHRQRPADLERPVRQLRDRAAHAAPEPRSACRRGRRRSGRCRRASPPSPFEEIAGGPPGGDGHRRLADAVDALDRDASASPTRSTIASCGWKAAAAGSTTAPTGRPLGYGYAGESGRLGPVAALDADLVAPDPRPPDRGRRAPRRIRDVGRRGRGPGDRRPRSAAGFRLDGFPVLLCWDRPFADFSRYLPISPGLP